MPEPISDELLGVDLGDKRLNRRRQVLQALSVNPQASMNGAFEKWGDTLAAYQLLRNDSVAPQGRRHAGGDSQATLRIDARKDRRTACRNFSVFWRVWADTTTEKRNHHWARNRSG